MAKAKHPKDYSFNSFQMKLSMVKEAKFSRASSPTMVRELCEDIANLSQEAFVVLTLNAKNNVIDKHMVTLGLIDASLVHPREVFKRAIMDDAASIILVHNHPSGDITPSAEDIRVTNQLIAAGKILDIQVIDHVIVSTSKHNPFLSFVEANICTFR